MFLISLNVHRVPEDMKQYQDYKREEKLLDEGVSHKVGPANAAVL